MRLFNGMANSRDVINGVGDFVGLKLNGKLNIIKIGHQFNDVCEVEIKVYKQGDLIKTQTISHSKPNYMQWSDFELDVDGEYFIGYTQGEPKALRKDLTWRKEPCKCDSNSYKDYIKYSKQVDVVGFNGFDAINTTSNYGLNLEF